MSPKAPSEPYIPRPLPQQQAARAPRPVPPKGPVDIRQTTEYKSAVRKWTSAIVALPIVMYTSWILYERIYGNKSVKKLTLQKKEEPSSSS
ncbi:uncharacterized protein N7498_006605 [Penicillium cinerascens]|uniref:Uncharacterized protein n=1 Tax=Penicillium cinerascens TaxID=70096 RepID=A0A9W9MIJ2_9EURO|nr:uncharacterized protein N7498_006605 [Penicillium cinerascens]KAJ5201942.1 hypothetical protein N7498_006605 [Penicillium cinerascens]